MIKKIISLPALAAMLALSATSCIDDNSAYGGKPLPTISVTVPGDEEMPVYSFNYGEDCVITPEVNYNGGGNLTYEWSVGTYNNGIKGPLEPAGNEKTLVHFFPQGGSYYAHLVISDGEIGFVQEYEISINRTFEQGYMVLSNTPDNRGNLVFIKDRTREEIEAGVPQTIMENCLQRVNPGIDDADLVGAQIVQWYAWAGTTVAQVTRLAVMTSKAGYYVDPNTFVISSTINCEDIVPGFHANSIFLNGLTPVMVDNTSKKYISLNSQYMFGFESSLYKGKEFDLIQSNTFMSGRNQTTHVYFVKQSPLVLSITYAYTDSGWSSSDTIDEKDENGNTFFTNEELLSIFKGEGISGDSGIRSYPATLLTRNKNTGEIFVTAFTGVGGYSPLIFSSRGKIDVTASTQLPDLDSKIVWSDTYHRGFFSKGNHLFVMLKNGSALNFPSQSQAAITFPDNEEITYMTLSTESGNENIIIATVDKNTGRGNLYFYDVKDVRTDYPNPEPQLSYLNCADRINYITYKPRIAN